MVVQKLKHEHLLLLPDSLSPGFRCWDFLSLQFSFLLFQFSSIGLFLALPFLPCFMVVLMGVELLFPETSYAYGLQRPPQFCSLTWKLPCEMRSLCLSTPLSNRPVYLRRDWKKQGGLAFHLWLCGGLGISSVSTPNLQKTIQWRLSTLLVGCNFLLVPQAKCEIICTEFYIVNNLHT